MSSYRNWYKKLVDINDPQTGEKLGKTPFWVKGKINLHGEFIMARQEGFLRLAKEPDLTGEDRKVLDVYFGNLDFENFVQISQQAIAD